MSLIAAMMCEEGVVIGTVDCAPAGASAVSVSAAGTTFEVGRDVILAGTGRMGLGQRFAQVLAAVRSDSRFGQWEALRAARTICAEAVEDFASTGSAAGQFAALVAFPSADGCQLCEFAAADLQPELKTPAQPFACLGDARPAGESFLRFLHQTLLARSLPAPAEALFAVTWTLLAVAALDPASRGAPLRLAALEREGPEMPPAARLLTPKQVSAQVARVRAAGRHLARFRKRLTDG